jgi:soluble lytic murein transglycosylase-like protein
VTGVELAAVAVLAGFALLVARTAKGGTVLKLPPVLRPFEPIISDEASRQGVDAYLIAAVILVESSGIVDATNVSAKETSLGLMMINIRAHPEYERNALLTSPAYNIAAGAAILADSIETCSRAVGDDAAEHVGVAGYNTGPSRAIEGFRVGDPDKFTTHSRGHGYSENVAQAYANMTGYRPWT